MAKKKKSAKRKKKTVQHIVTAICCLLLATLAWLFVDIYNTLQDKSVAETETALSSEVAVCEIAL